MRNLRVGCCGFQKSQAVYYQNFDLIEIQQTFYKLPMLKTAERWRMQAPPNFIFTLKAWQLITHEPYQPTYARSGLDIPLNERDRYGSFRPTMEVFEAWERTREIAVRLEAPVVVFQCPPQFTPTRLHVDNMRVFFERVRRDNLIFAWEPRGEWPPELVASLCSELRLLHCVDPFLQPSLTSDRYYFRMHGGSDYSHQFAREELLWLSQQPETDRLSFYLFNNVHMWEDALRFKDLIADRLV